MVSHVEKNKELFSNMEKSHEEININKNMSVNLQAPFVINADEKKACQIIVDSDKYPVRFPIYDIIKKDKED